MRKIIAILTMFFIVVAVYGSPLLQAKEPVTCVKYDDVRGSGKYPYNFRAIDNKLFAGGNLFNPVGHLNSEEKVLLYLKLIKTLGAKNIIALNVSKNDKEIKILEKLCGQEKISLYKCPMNNKTVPDEKQTQKIMELISEGAYVHCNWGADRTGAVIAKYLRRKKNYTGFEAWSSVISGGACAGKLGGLKQTPEYKNLILYFWPEVKENLKIYKIYNIY